MSEGCERLHHLFGRLPRHSFPFDGEAIPKNGIYVLFERGESGHGTDRIVRVGTHTGMDQLLSRLNQHFVNENKDRSIFRKNIGRALLNQAHDPFLAQWELDLTPKENREKFGGEIDFAKQKEVERRVSAYLQNNFSFVVFQVDDKTDRMDLEARIIATIAACEACGASKQWLGLHSPKEKIRKSGLWLVQRLNGTPLTGAEIQKLEGLV